MRSTAHLQLRTLKKPESCSAARERPVMNTTRMSHREHRVERAGTSSWLEEL